MIPCHGNPQNSVQLAIIIMWFKCLSNIGMNACILGPPLGFWGLWESEVMKRIQRTIHFPEF